MDDQLIQTELEAILSHWNRIEGRVKEAEQVRLEVVIPAVNELRYAGRQLVDAWKTQLNPTLVPSDWEQEIRKRLIVAQQYLQNADHDITDAIITFIDKKIRAMAEEYGVSALITSMPDYQAFRKTLDEANKIVRDSRENRNGRAENYQRLQQDIVPMLIEKHHILSYVAEISFAKKKANEFARRAFDVIGLFGGIASIIALAASWDAVKAYFGGIWKALGAG